jgi:hypothetical protein
MLYLPVQSSSSLEYAPEVSGMAVVPDAGFRVTVLDESGNALSLENEPSFVAGSIVQEFVPLDFAATLTWFDVEVVTEWSVDGKPFVDRQRAMLVPGDWDGYGSVRSVGQMLQMLTLTNTSRPYTRADVGDLLGVESTALHAMLPEGWSGDVTLADRVVVLRVAASLYEAVALGKAPDATKVGAASAWREQADALVEAMQTSDVEGSMKRGTAGVVETDAKVYPNVLANEHLSRG